MPKVFYDKNLYILIQIYHILILVLQVCICSYEDLINTAQMTNHHLNK